jgi:hypothetical protein
MIRAARLGWHHSPRHGCFIRMADADGMNTRVELCPVNAVPSTKTKFRDYRCWWEGPDVLGMIPWLKGVMRIKRYVCVVIDEHGAIIRSEA